MLAKLFIPCMLLFLCSCGSTPSSYEIGVDPSWYPLTFHKQQNSILGFSTDILTQVSIKEDISFSLLETNWDSLLDGLNSQKYQAVLTSLTPYNFNQSVYSFSEPFLPLGPVLIVPLASSEDSLKGFSGKSVGVIEDSPEILILEKDPTILIRTYENASSLLTDLVAESIQAGLLPILTASAYVDHLYYKKLKIASDSLTNQGLRLITLKDKNPKLIEKFNDGIEKLKKSGEYEKLLVKWNLAN
ncbi:MAG: transporter substrate-binding domain-containing protein [Rhabdochlamydiaceae bacterium]|nr:transporter substrate-binding domain-containing protein [Rhabdochlamydiaceae bacterium]